MKGEGRGIVPGVSAEQAKQVCAGQVNEPERPSRTTTAKGGLRRQLG
uniref:Lipoprotein n=1 Tax=Schistosoma curassoni TaxID=6186 RepID=A0A183JVB7_9TREM